MTRSYQEFLERKLAAVQRAGAQVDEAEINPILRAHARAMVR